MPVSFNGSYSQNFDTLANSGTGNAWTNDTTLSGWSLFRQPSPGTAITAYDTNNGSSLTGSFYSYGTTGNTDRALGGVGSGGAYFGSPGGGAIAGWLAFAATNNTGTTLDNFTLSFNGEQWRNGGDGVAQNMALEYGFGSSFSTVSSWTAPGSTFDWTSPVAIGSAASVDGNAAGRVSSKGGTINTPWANGNTLWVRWKEVNDSGNDHGLAIDDFSLTATRNPTANNDSAATTAGTKVKIQVLTNDSDPDGDTFYISTSTPPSNGSISIEDEVYAGGAFTTAGSASANYIAKWDGTSWSPLGSGLNALVTEIAFSGSNLYVGGAFTTAGSASANYIAKWDGTSWSPLGSGMNNTVRAIDTSGGNVYAGGNFTTAGSASANYIAKWDGTSWSPLGSGVNIIGVYAIAASGSNVYAGGPFNTAGSTSANYIAKWDGTSWSALGLGLDQGANTILISGGNVYAGGPFNTAGSMSAKHSAKWDGTSWSALGSGLNNTVVYGSAISGSNYYIGGDFTTAGGASAKYIAKWDGTSWSALGSGMNNTVRAIDISGSNVYVGGDFTTAGSASANYIAKWNGTSWSSLGSGMNSTVRTIAVNPGRFITYTPNAGFNGVDTFTYTINDRNGGTATATTTVLVNDSPVLDNSGNAKLTDVAFNDFTNSGITITNLIASGAGGNPITDPNTSAVEGIAITAIDTTNGAWQYTTNGTTWNNFPAVSATNALLLAADGTTKIRFVPTSGYNGTVTNGITFNAWDKITGTNGSTANITTDLATNGTSSPFSTASETASVTVTAPPTVSLTATDTIAEEGNSNTGTFRITRSSSSGTLAVQLSPASGIGTDYNLSVASGGTLNASGTIFTFNDSVSTADITFTAIDDIPAEANETFALSLVSDTAYTVDAANNTGSVTIAQNDFVVTNTNDSGEGSLRQAMTNANAIAGTDTITFNITGSGPHTISPTSTLPTISQAVIIDGYSQSGASKNTLAAGNNAQFKIVLDGINAGGVNGITLDSGSNGSTIQGLTINRFQNRGILIQSTNNFIVGNFIGTDVTGTIDLGNSSHGINVSATNNTIGGATVGDRNLISGNNGNGIFLFAGNNAIANNYIGTNASGTATLGNTSDGIQVQSGSNTFTNNLISGNQNGIYLEGGSATANQVRGNYIGTDVTGTQDLGNTVDGVQITGSSNIIGGSNASDRNLISGNNRIGIGIFSANANTIQGNYIGINASGTTDLGNTSSGIWIQSGSSNSIGTNADGINDTQERNIISGNDNNGISIVTSNNNNIAGNYIGTNATGTLAIANADTGVWIVGSNNLVGTYVSGTNDAAKPNLLSGNAGSGVSFNSNTTINNQVGGNFIGSDVTGNNPLPNNIAGVRIAGGANNNIVGGTTNQPLQSNIIAFNPVGVFANADTASNSIVGNRIFSNTNLGIDLGNNGVTANDAGDGDTGANNQQNFPVITFAEIAGSNTACAGTFNSTANNTFRMEFFANDVLDTSGNGEGKTYLGFTNITTDASGNTNFSVTNLSLASLGNYVTATATNLTTNDTSEFSNGVIIDVPTVSITSASISNAEGNSGITDYNFTVTLSRATTQNVTVNYTTNDGTAIVANNDYIDNDNSITFTPGGSLTQTITVQAKSDNIVENNETFTVSLNSATNAQIDTSAKQGTGTITNDDTAGVTITQSGSSTDITEGSTTDTYDIVLTSQPTSDVTIAINNGTQTGTSPTSVTFTSANWNTPQTITVSAINDNVVEGNHNSTISHTASSSDANYNGIAINSVTANITDNDTAGVTITQSGGSTDITEGGATNSYDIVLTSQPTSNVTIAINNGTQTGTSPTSLTFTSANWNTPQSVTVNAVNDSVAEGNHAETITHTATSSDTNYNGIAINSIIANITDNDNAGVTITESGGSTDITESGATDTYNVVLTSQPTSDVTIAINNGTQTGTSPTSVTFTSANWNIAQTVTVNAVNDSVAEGNHTGTITHTATSSDANYNGIAISDITANITDNDNAGVTITKSGGSTDITEGGATDTYDIVLTSQPTSDVTINIGNGAQTETSATTVTFTSANWNTPQTVTVTATNDNVVEGNHTGTITHTATSSDANYNGIAINSVTANITDNDNAGVTITQSGSSTDITEGSTTDTYDIVLTSQPTSDVTIAINNGTQTGTSPTTVTFNSSNWNIAQIVTVNAVNDSFAEGNHTATITHTATSSDANYNAIAISNIIANITDNDTAGITITQSGSSTDITEGSTTDTYDIVLTSQPTFDVTITINNGTQTGTSPTSVTFTSADWNIAQTVTVSAVNDNVAEGNHTGTITHTATSSDANYNGITISDITANITDNDSAGVTITQSGGSTDITEGGATDTYDIVLTSQPTSDVTIAINNGTQTGTSPTSVTFTSADWNIAQTVTVSAVNDNVAEGNHTGTITHTATSSDANYNGITISDITANITDNDSAGVTITQSGGSTDITEGGATDTYDIVLTSQPTSDVTIAINNGTQTGTSPTSVTFTSADWNIAQTVTVSAVNDNVAEGNHTGTITHTATSSDANYNGITISDITANITDNDSAGVTITQSGGSTDITEGGATDTYDIVLTSQPTSDVTIAINNGTQTGTSPTSVTFTSADWNIAQTVTVSAVNDNVAEGNHTGTITHTATSNDAKYNSIAINSITANITDDDTAGFTITPTTLTTGENSTTANFTVKLNSQPTADVILGLTSSNTAEGKIDKSSLIFTANNWNTAQTVTIIGIDDNIVDGDRAYQIITAAASSTDSNYNNVNPVDINVTNTDNDSATVSITPVAIAQTEGNNGAIAYNFTVNLSHPSVVPVTVAYTTDSGTATANNDFADNDSTIDFNPGETSKSITVNVLGDTIPERDEIFTVNLISATNATLNSSAKQSTGIINNDDIEEDDCFCKQIVYPNLDTLTGEGGPNRSLVLPNIVNITKNGTANNDILIGNNISEALNGLDSDDLQLGNAGNDNLIANAGNDTAFGGIDRDWISGNEGDDVLNGNEGDDVLNGNTDNDTVRGGQGNDLVRGGNQNDLICGDIGDDTLAGDRGNDTIFGSNTENESSDVNGRDLLFGGSSNDLQNGNAGNDTLFGDDGNDTVRGGKNDDIVAGNFGEDMLFGDNGNDSLCGDEGNDTIYGGNGSTVPIGANGERDCICGGEGNDLLFGNEGQDRIWAEEGDDTLCGGKDNDTLKGGAGSDRLLGDLGNDILAGGSGRDIFVLFPGKGTDTILDFEDNLDLLELGGNLSFSQLTIIQGNNATLIALTQTSEVLAFINSIQPSAIGLQDFVFS